MDLKKKYIYFLTKDPILVLDFLTRFVRKENIQEVSVAQAFDAIPSFLTEISLIDLERELEKASPEERGMTSWPETVKHLLPDHSQHKNISQAIKVLKYIRQKLDETERQLATRFNKGMDRCGNVNSIGKNITYDVDAILPTKSYLVGRYMKANGHTSFLDIRDVDRY